VIKFIEINRFYDGKDNYQLYSVPAVAISILIIPLFDTLRVFTVRILKKRSPFSPDRSHLHHLLVDRGISHEKASLCLLGISFFLSVITFLLQHLDGELLLLFLICAMSLITYFFKRNHKEKR
jgi:hypothetical protein